MHVAPTRSGPGPSTQHRVVADVAPSLCFASTRDATGVPRASRLLLIGPVCTPRFYRPTSGARMEAVRIRPEWSRTLLRADLRDHVDGIDDMRHINRLFGERLLDQLRATRTSTEAVDTLVGALTSDIPRRRETGAGLAHEALWSLRSQDFGRPLRDLATDLGVSSRHLRRVVGRTAGSSPRRCRRVERFLRLVREADELAEPSWVDLAVGHGYADQAHLIRESRAFSGVTPTVLHAERRNEV